MDAKYMKPAADKVAAALTGAGIEFSFKETPFGDGIFTFFLPLRGAAEGLLEFSVEMGDIYKNKGWSCIIRAMLPVIRDEFGHCAGKLARNGIYEYCSRVNEKYHRGCMYMDEEDRIWFRHYYEFNEDDDLADFVGFIHIIVSEAEAHGFGIYNLLLGMVPRDALKISQSIDKMLSLDIPIETRAELDGRTMAMFDELVEKMESEKLDLDKASSIDLVHGPMDEAELMVFGLLKKSPALSRKKMAEQLSKDVKTVQEALDKLIKMGYIKRAGSKRRPVWDILK